MGTGRYCQNYCLFSSPAALGYMTPSPVFAPSSTQKGKITRPSLHVSVPPAYQFDAHAAVVMILHSARRGWPYRWICAQTLLHLVKSVGCMEGDHAGRPLSWSHGPRLATRLLAELVGQAYCRR